MQNASVEGGSIQKQFQGKTNHVPTEITGTGEEAGGRAVPGQVAGQYRVRNGSELAWIPSLARNGRGYIIYLFPHLEPGDKE